MHPITLATERARPSEDRDEIEAAPGHCRKGIDLADALHLAASKACSELISVLDYAKGFAHTDLVTC